MLETLALLVRAHCRRHPPLQVQMHLEMPVMPAAGYLWRDIDEGDSSAWREAEGLGPHSARAGGSQLGHSPWGQSSSRNLREE